MDQRGFAGGKGDGPPRLRRRRHGPSLRALVCALGLLGSTTIGLGFLYSTPDTPKIVITAAALQAKPAKIALVRREMALLDPALTAGYEPAPFGRSAPLRSRFEHEEGPQVVVEASLESDVPQDVAVAEQQASAQAGATPLARDVPLPTPRPGFARPPRAQPRRLAALETPPSPAAITPPHDGRTLLERMFGAPATPSANPALAYAAPGDIGGFFGSRASASTGSGTAVYNIAMHTVTLPNGTQLEAHSGLGTHLDDPNSVTERMRGATPPTIYELSQREALFHGVRALRLTPLLEGTTFGRGGLLAHTFMLGPRGDSNGCVVFRNYAAFLAAYDTGQIRRLLVVAGG